MSHLVKSFPGSSLPNQAAYRMSPSEHEELSRQVSERMKKGLVRERVSCGLMPHIHLHQMKKENELRQDWIKKEPVVR